MARGKMGMVYLMKSTCGKYYKYGCSGNISQRLSAINVRNPFDCRFELLISFGTSYPFELENKIKWAFIKERICLTEYFIASESESPECDIIDVMRREWVLHNG